MKGTVNIPDVSVIIKKEGKMLFVLRQNTGFSDGMYCLPSGHVEDGERFTEAAVRESLEEVNVTLHPDDLKPVFTIQRLYADEHEVRTGLFFEATKWDGTPKNNEPERHGELAWFDADDLPFDKIMAFHADALKGIQQGKIFIETGWDMPAGSA